MGWFSSVTHAVSKVGNVATKVATAPTRITAKLASKVLPKSIGNVLTKAATFNPGTFAVNRALSTLAPSRQSAAPAAAAAPLYSSSRYAPSSYAQPAAPSFFSRMTNAITQPSASPSSGQMLAPAAVQAAVASQGGPTGPTSSVSTSWAGGGGGGGGGYGGGGGSGYGGGDDGGNDYGGGDDGGDAESDPTADMPPEMFEARDDDGSADLGDIDYHAALAGELEGAFARPRLRRPGAKALKGQRFRRPRGLSGELEGLGDWKSDLTSFGKQVGGTVAKQALVAVGNKIAGGAKAAAPPPPSPGLPMAAKVAIGGAAALGVVLLVSSGRHHSSSAT